MKNKINIIIVLAIILSQSLVSCEDYLEVPPEASKTEEDIFSDFRNFQGYVTTIYFNIPIRINNGTVNPAIGGEVIRREGYPLSAVQGDYRALTTGAWGYHSFSNSKKSSIWIQGWKAIRIANIGLEHMDMLEGTDEEKAKIKGQLHFLRAWFHFQMLEAYGPIPYIDHVLVNDLDQPRYFEYNGKWGYQAVTERIVEDLDEAANLLPVSWDEPTNDYGRATSLAALAYKAKALLFAGSPMPIRYSQNGKTVATGADNQVDKEYMQRAAEAAAAAIKLAEANIDAYEFMTWADYGTTFYHSNNTVATSKEVIFQKINNYKAAYTLKRLIGENFIPDGAIFEGRGNPCTVTQNYVDKFEMADGSLYKEEYDQDNARRWDDRDPRFRRAIYVDRDKQGAKKKTVFNLYMGGSTRIAKDNEVQTPYIIHKFWAPKANKQDKGIEYKKNTYSCPYMRLPELYLMYAEAVNEWKGDANQSAGDLSMTALGAVNKIRERCGHVDATADGGQHGSFRELVLNERAVELCFEGPYFNDIRRWSKGKELNNMPIYDMQFDKDWTNFTRVKIATRLYETPRNDWMPLPRDLTLMYDDFPQNEGWE